MHHVHLIDFCLLGFAGLVAVLFILRAIVLIFFSIKYGYNVPFVMLFYWFPQEDVKNTFHFKIKTLKELYNKTTVPFVLIFLLIIGMKVFLTLIR